MPPWMIAAERSASPVAAPTCRRSASVRASSCSIGRNRVEESRKTTDQRTTISPYSVGVRLREEIAKKT